MNDVLSLDCNSVFLKFKLQKSKFKLGLGLALGP